MSNKPEGYNDNNSTEISSEDSHLSLTVCSLRCKLDVLYDKQNNSALTFKEIKTGEIEGSNVYKKANTGGRNDSNSSLRIVLSGNSGIRNSLSDNEGNCIGHKYSGNEKVSWFYKCTASNHSWRAYSDHLSNLIENNYRHGVKYFVYYPFVFDFSIFVQTNIVTGKESYLLRNNMDFCNIFSFGYRRMNSIYLLEIIINCIQYGNLVVNINKVFKYCKLFQKTHKYIKYDSIRIGSGNGGITDNAALSLRGSTGVLLFLIMTFPDCISPAFPEMFSKFVTKPKNKVKSRKILFNNSVIREPSGLNDYFVSNEDICNNNKVVYFRNGSGSFSHNRTESINAACHNIDDFDRDVCGSIEYKVKDNLNSKEKGDFKELSSATKHSKNANSCFLFTPHNYRKGLGIIVPKTQSHRWNKNSNRIFERSQKSKYVRFNFAVLSSPDIHKKNSSAKSCHVGTPRRGISGHSSNNNHSKSSSLPLETPTNESNAFMVSCPNAVSEKIVRRDSTDYFTSNSSDNSVSGIFGINSELDADLQNKLSQKLSSSNLEEEEVVEGSVSVESRVNRKKHKFLGLNSITSNKGLVSKELIKEAKNTISDRKSSGTKNKGKATSEDPVNSYTHILEIEDWTSFDTVFGYNKYKYSSKSGLNRDIFEFPPFKSHIGSLAILDNKGIGSAICDERLKDLYYYYHYSTDSDGHYYQYDEQDGYADIDNNYFHDSVDYGVECKSVGEYFPLNSEYGLQDGHTCCENVDFHKSICQEDLNDFVSNKDKKIRWWFNHSIKHVSVRLGSSREVDKRTGVLKSSNKKLKVDIIPLIYPLLTGYLNELDIFESSIFHSKTPDPDPINAIQAQSKVLLGLKSVNINGLKPRRSEFSRISEFCFKEANNIVPISLVELKVIYSVIPISLFSMLLMRFPVPAANTFAFSFICNDDNIPNTGMQTVHIFSLYLSQNSCHFYTGKKGKSSILKQEVKNIFNEHSSCNHTHLDVFMRYNKVKICPWLAISNFIDEFILRTPILVKCIIDMHNIMIIPSTRRYCSSDNDNNKFIKIHSPRDHNTGNDENYRNHAEFVILTANLLLPLLIINSHSIQNIIVGPDSNDFPREMHEFGDKSSANLRIDSMIFTKKRLPFTFHNIRNFDLFLDHNIDKTELGVFISNELKYIFGDKLKRISLEKENTGTTIAGTGGNSDVLSANFNSVNTRNNLTANSDINKTRISIGSEYSAPNSTGSGNVSIGDLDCTFDFSGKLFGVINLWINEFVSWFDKYAASTVEYLSINLYLTSGSLEATNFGYDPALNGESCSKLDSKLLNDLDLIEIRKKFTQKSKAKHPLLSRVSFNIFISNNLRAFIFFLNQSNSERYLNNKSQQKY